MTFTYSVTAADWGRIAPELILAAMTLLVMIADLLLPQPAKGGKDSGPRNFILLPLLSLLGLADAFAATFLLFVAGDPKPAFNQMIGSDFCSRYAYIIFLSSSARRSAERRVGEARR